ncbi:hypothetical protein ZEAMMB73_Zm00001d020209 [Zea mays]|uniref:Uncharacterized protein n=2 Tax=Zea mays TaxID=4577 RepID=A0A1D6I2W2_MAIZE|nr:hypothetical protein ZEAMMB73_Zm00001d020209 [Zea mays]
MISPEDPRKWLVKRVVGMHGGSVTYLVDPGNNDSSSRTVVINYAYARDNETLFDIISVKVWSLSGYPGNFLQFISFVAEMAAAAGPYKEMLEVVNACATRIRWRLSPASKRRLLNGCAVVVDEQTQLLPNILFLCTRLRPVVLVDYGGTMPQLQENLCGLLYLARQFKLYKVRSVQFG